MKVHLEPDVTRGTVKVYFWEHDLIAGNTRALVYGGDAGWAWTVPAEGETIDPTLELPTDALEALVAAASDFLPPSSQMAEHLNDTRVVRDRLLALVERVVPGAGAE